MKSTHGEIPDWPSLLLVAAAPALIGALVALLIGLLTFGAQATADPRHVPLAVGTAEASAAPALANVTGNVAAQSGDRVDWRTVGSRAEAESLLDAKQIYGAVLFSPGPAGLSATVLVSGAVNPNATQAAQPILTQVAEGVTAATRRSPGAGSSPPAGTPAVPPVQVVTLHPTSPAGRILPLASGALLWLAALAANVLAVAVAPRLRGGRPLGRPAIIGTSGATALLGTGVVIGLAWLWDSALPISWELAGFVALVGAAFALLQAGVLRWLSLPGLALLGPLYLTALAVPGLPPEFLNPVYRALLWSWTPFRFSAEAVRSLMFIGSGAQDVPTAVWLFAGLALAGLLLMAAPRPRPRPVPLAELEGG